MVTLCCWLFIKLYMHLDKLWLFKYLHLLSPVHSHRMCSLIIPSTDSKTRPFTSTTCPKDATLPNFEKTVLDKTSFRRINSGSNTTTSCRRSAYVHIKKGYIGKDHCTLWNTFVVSSSVLAAAEDGRLASLLKVAVHLEAVVSRVGHCHVTVRREGQALGTIKGVR